MHVTISNRNAARFEDVLDYDADDTHTAGVNLGGYPIMGLLVPVVNGSPTITIEATIDGTNWYALKKSDGSTDAVSVVGGATAFFLGSDELTQLAAYVGRIPEGTQLKVRLKTSVAQTADRTFIWLGQA